MEEVKTRTLSPSAMETWQACRRKGWFRSVKREKTPQSEAAARGDMLHKAAEAYLQAMTWESLPYANGARAAIAHLPLPSTVDVELWAPRVPLSPGTVFTGRVDLLSTPESRDGAPLYDGAGRIIVDGETLWIGDHKTKGNNRWFKTPLELASDMQMLSYASAFQRAGLTAATKVAVTHYYYVYPKEVPSPEFYIPETTYVHATPTQAALDANWEGFERIAAEVEPYYNAATQEDVPFNLARCGDYGGCDFAHLCTAARNRPKVSLSRAFSDAQAKSPPNQVVDADGTQRTPLSSTIVTGPRRTAWHDYDKATQGEKQPMAFPTFKKSTPAPAAQSTPAAPAAPSAESETPMTRNEPAMAAPENKSAVVPPDAPASVTPTLAQWVEFITGPKQDTDEAVVARLHALSLPTEPTFVRVAVSHQHGLLLTPSGASPYAQEPSLHTFLTPLWETMVAKGTPALPLLAAADAFNAKQPKALPFETVSKVLGTLISKATVNHHPVLIVGEGPRAWAVRNPDWDGTACRVIKEAPASTEAAEQFGASNVEMPTPDKFPWHLDPRVVEGFKAFVAQHGGVVSKVAPHVKAIVNGVFGENTVSSVRSDRIKGLCEAAGLEYQEAAGIVRDRDAITVGSTTAPPKPTPTPRAAPAPRSVPPDPDAPTYATTLYVGCWPEDLPVQDLLTSSLIADAIEKVETDEGVAHYTHMGFGKGPGAVASLVKMALRQNLVDVSGAWFLPRREDALVNALLPIFKAAGWRIVRCVG